MYLLGLYTEWGIMKKKTDAQGGRVNTFHVLQPIYKGPSYYKLCLQGPLRFHDFKILIT
jgi:hypothetical protein